MGNIGKFCWHDLVTTDVDAAKRFYGSVVGWRAEDVPGMNYAIFNAETGPATGLMALDAGMSEAGACPGWTGYVAVADTDAIVAKAQSLGATVRMPPTDIPNVGRFAVLADPQGAVFAVIAGTGSPPDLEAQQAQPGFVGWNELTALDWSAVFPFYETLFGWQKDHAMEMGPMGTYQMIKSDGPVFGAMFSKFGEAQGPRWLAYFNVADFDAATARIAEQGGKVVHGPVEVPGGQWIAQALDPQGAAFAIVGHKS